MFNLYKYYTTVSFFLFLKAWCTQNTSQYPTNFLMHKNKIISFKENLISYNVFPQFCLLFSLYVIFKLLCYFSESQKIFQCQRWRNRIRQVSESLLWIEMYSELVNNLFNNISWNYDLSFSGILGHVIQHVFFLLFSLFLLFCCLG